MSSLPTPLRAALGLFATALDTVQELVEHAPELPMEAVGNSMQLSMRLQQHYTALLTRGDEFLAGLRGAPEEPPAWATFDDSPVSGESAESAAEAFAGDEFAEHPDAEGPADLPDAEIQDEPRQAGQGDPLLAGAVTPHFTDLDPTAESDLGAAGRAPARKTARATTGHEPTATPSDNATTTKAAARKVGAKGGARKVGATTSGAAKAVPVKKAAAPATASSSARKAMAGKTTAGKATAGKATAGSATARHAAAGKMTAGKAAGKATVRKAAARKAPAGTATNAQTTAGKATAADSAANNVARAPRATAKKVARTAPPTLDANLDNGDASARSLSAFDRAPGPTETTEVGRGPDATSGPSGSDAPAAD